jgi:hypothetical protein
VDVGVDHRVAFAVNGIVPVDAEVLGVLPSLAFDVRLRRALEVFLDQEVGDEWTPRFPAAHAEQCFLELERHVGPPSLVAMTLL